MLVLEHATEDLLRQSTISQAKLRRFRSISSVGDDNARRAALASLIESFTDEHLNWHVKQAALKAFNRIAKRGDQFAVDPVRQLAVDVLADVVSRGHPAAISAVSTRLNDNGWHVRKSAVDALAKIVLRDDERSIVAASHLIQDRSPEVRQAVLQMLGKIAKGNTGAMAAVCSCIDHEEKQIRQTAIRAILIVAEKGDHRSISALSTCLGDDDLFLRCEAARILGQVVEKGDKFAIGAVCENFLRTDWHIIRKDVIQAFHQLAAVGDDRAVVIVAGYFESPDEHVKEAAIDVLAEISNKDDEYSIDHLTALSEDESALVRKAAVDAFVRLSSKDNTRTIQALSWRVVDSDIYVRWAAVRAVGQIAGDSDCNEFAVDALAEALEHTDFNIAGHDLLKAFGKITRVGHPHTERALAARLKHQSWRVRLTALQIFSKLSSWGDKDSINAVRMLQKDQQPEVAQLAYKVAATAKFEAAALNADGGEAWIHRRRSRRARSLGHFPNDPRIPRVVREEEGFSTLSRRRSTMELQFAN